MARIQRSVRRRVGDKTYYQYRIIVSSKILSELKWDEGTEISIRILKKKLVVEKTN
jgi:hypothetical protein